MTTYYEVSLSNSSGRHVRCTIDANSAVHAIDTAAKLHGITPADIMFGEATCGYSRWYYLPITRQVVAC